MNCIAPLSFWNAHTGMQQGTRPPLKSVRIKSRNADSNHKKQHEFTLTPFRDLMIVSILSIYALSRIEKTFSIVYQLQYSPRKRSTIYCGFKMIGLSRFFFRTRYEERKAGDPASKFEAERHNYLMMDLGSAS